jgi:hypothetical protein
MGTSINAQQNHQSDYVIAVQDMNNIVFKFEFQRKPHLFNFISRYNRMPWLWIKPIFYLLGYGYRYDQCLALLTDFTRNVGQ